MADECDGLVGLLTTLVLGSGAAGTGVGAPIPLIDCATEMGAACLRVGFEELGLEEIVAFTLPANRASRRVMEKLGFCYERDFVHVGLEHVLYRLRWVLHATATPQ